MKEVPADVAGLRLDQALTRLFPEFSRKTARQALLTGRVKLNGRVVRIIARTVKLGDKLVLGSPANDPPLNGGSPGGATMGGSAVSGPASRHVELRIVHENADFIVINKPGALLSERVEHEKGDAVGDVLQRMGKGKTILVHRLDAGTSGVMIVARNAATAEWFNHAFRDGKVEKSYLLLCTGVPGEGVYDGALGRDPKHPRRFAVRPDGKRSRTGYRTLVSVDGLSLANARPETGRTHQIRVHFAHGGHALLGDRMYGGLGRKSDVLFDRPLLHAWALEFPGHKRFVVEPPEDFARVQQAFGLTANFALLDPLW